MNKKEENAVRVRYVRALERFSKSIVSYLSKVESATKEGYAKKVKNASKLLDRAMRIALYKGELQDLEKLVEKMRLYASNEEKEIEDIKKEILYAANQLEKSKNFKKYKKPKHAKGALDEWE